MASHGIHRTYADEGEILKTRLELANSELKRAQLRIAELEAQIKTLTAENGTLTRQLMEERMTCGVDPVEG